MVAVCGTISDNVDEFLARLLNPGARSGTMAESQGDQPLNLSVRMFYFVHWSSVEVVRWDDQGEIRILVKLVAAAGPTCVFP
jgi:hypothetical protein